MRLLFVDRDHSRCTALVRMAAGATYSSHVHNGPEECFVLEGDLHVGDALLRRATISACTAADRGTRFNAPPTAVCC
jgi:hypothetical protein